MPRKPKMIWIRCDWCGRLKQVEARDRKRGWGRFCDRKCSGRWWASQENYPFNRNQQGKSNPNWRGGITIHCKGYIYRYAPGHPRASNGYVFEHILVAEKMLGRYLRPGETVHHKNGRKADNRPENIHVFDSPGAHVRYHAALRRAACGPAREAITS